MRAALAGTALLVAACGGGDRPDGDAGGRASTTAAGAREGSTSTPAATSSPATVDEGTTTAPPTTAVTGRAFAPAATAAVPMAGRYELEVTEDRGDGPETSARTQSVAVMAGTAGSPEGTIELTTDAGPSHQTVTLALSAAGRFTTTTSTTNPLGTGSPCRWDPPWPVHGPLVVGQRWRFDTSCTSTLGTSTTALVMSGSGEVVGPETRSVGGAPVATWVIRSSRRTDATVTLEGGKRVEQQVDETRTDWLDPGSGMIVRTESVTVLTGANAETISRTEQLRSLSPA